MPFEVTATRKRPQNFDQLAGQNFVAATLISSLEQGRIAHAYLFSGPRGCGKTSTARILAKALNCEQGPSATPCGTCASCAAISSGTSLDVIEIDGASNTSVDNIRQIKDEVLFAPNSGRYKIYIIDEVHMLSMSAFNALLKTIEEPPPYIVFIFATTEPHKVPATIKSRCQQFNFRLVPVETILDLLRQAAAETGIQAEDEALLWIAREAAGSVRDAYTLFDQIASFSGQLITAQNIRETLGLVGIDQLNALFRAATQGDSKSAFEQLDSIFARGVSPEQFLTDAVDYCRSALLLSCGVQKEGLLSGPRSSFEPSVLESLSAQQLEYAIALFLDAYRHLKETVDPRYEVELAIANLSHIRSYISPGELIDAVRALQKGLGGAAPSARSTTPVSGTERPAREEAPTSPFRDHSAGEGPQPAHLLRDLSSRLNKQPERVPSGESVAAPSAAAAQNPGSRPEEARPAATQPASAALSSDELRKSIISKLKAQNLFLASALEKSGAWLPKHNGYIIPVLNRVEMDLISRFASVIAETGAAILGTPCAIEVQSAKDLERASSSQSAPPSGSAHSAPQNSAPQPATPTPLREQEQSLAPGPDQRNASALSEDVSFTSESMSPPELGSAGESPFAPEMPAETSLRDPAPPAAAVPHAAAPHTVDPGNPAENISPGDMQIVETVRKLFKGKIVASTPAAAPSAAGAELQPTVAPQPSAVSEDIENEEDYSGGEEEYD